MHARVVQLGVGKGREVSSFQRSRIEGSTAYTYMLYEVGILHHCVDKLV